MGKGIGAMKRHRYVENVEFPDDDECREFDGSWSCCRACYLLLHRLASAMAFPATEAEAEDG